MPTLDELWVYPIKSLDGAQIDAATVVTNGGLSADRRYVMVDENGEYVTGKRERAVHRIRATYDDPLERVTLRSPVVGTQRFHLDADRTAMEAWLTDHFGYPVTLEREDDGGVPDDTEASGPTLLSTGTLRTVAGWFRSIEPAELCRRLRPNLVVDAEPFWEDRLYDRPGTTVPFRIGIVTFEGVNPCQRCIVPTRDPDTGETRAGFRERFVEKRRETLPPWADTAWFDHYFRLMVNTRVPRSSWGQTLRTGDEVAIAGKN